MENLMKRFLFVAALIPALVACSVPEEDFPETYGKAMCKQISKCDKADYESAYDDDDDCRDDWADVADFILDAGDLLGQTYSEEKATDCISELKKASCDDFDDGDYECEVFE
jgi:hypothetical protein